MEKNSFNNLEKNLVLFSMWTLFGYTSISSHSRRKKIPERKLSRLETWTGKYRTRTGLRSPKEDH